MAQVTLSICIVNWNLRDLLAQALDALYASRTDFAFEVIVVDNASTDGSCEMVAARFPQARLVRNTSNRSFAPGCNQAAALSQGEYLFFLNNDTRVSPDSLQILVDYLRAHPEVGMVGPRIVGADRLWQRSFRAKPTLGALLHRLPLLRWTRLYQRAYEDYRRCSPVVETKAVEVLQGMAVCLPRRVFEQHQGWDESFFFGLEEIDLSVRVAATHRVVYLDDAEVVHHNRMSSRRNAGWVYTGMEVGHVRYLRKHLTGPAGARLYKLLVLLNLPFTVANEVVRGVRRSRHRDPLEPPFNQLAALGYFLTRGLPSFLRA